MTSPGSFVARRIEVDPMRMLRMLGYAAGAPVRHEVLATAQSMAELAMGASSPRAAYVEARIAGCTPEGLVLADGTRFRGPTFLAELRDCARVVAFVLSLGARFDTLQRNLSAAGRTLEVHLLELAGWLGIEDATRQLKKHLEGEAAAEGLSLRRRLAPGYTTRVGGVKVEWPLEDHPALFSLFDPETCPARLLEGGCAMTPKMSRSGIFGLATSPETTHA